ncbi:hypothetical protein [Sporosarcina sp. FSL K6-3457]|uniref:hypothetical protein n=1 Tax=Sporosarcina sp. FSL K6-3457 TaxID=2978204 RepID=UPI0030F5BF4D
MEINQVRLDEIKAELAERHQLSIEEVSRMIDNVIIGVTGMVEWLVPFVERLTKLWNQTKDVAIENYEKSLWNTGNEAICGWDLKWDTRKRSQVMSNKPKFMVRKIIR